MILPKNALTIDESIVYFYALLEKIVIFSIISQILQF